MRLPHLAAPLALLLGQAAGGSQASAPFRDLPPAEARELAKREQRFLVLAFYAPACAPCDQLDRTLFADPSVRSWIEARALALRLDKAPDLAAYHAIGPRPTLLVLGPAGEEIERFDTLVSPAEFLEGIELGAAERASEKAERERPEVAREAHARLKKARALAQAQQHAEALVEYDWVLGKTRAFTSWNALRLDHAVPEVAQLARKLPEAHAGLVNMRERAKAALLAESAPSLPELVLSARELAAVNQALLELEHTREVWNALRARASCPRAVLEALFNEPLAAHLLRTKRYAELLAGSGDPLVQVEHSLARIQELSTAAKDDPGVLPQLVGERNHGIHQAARCYEALLGTGRESEASGLAEMLLLLEPRAQAYLALATAAGNAGQPSVVRALLERARSALAGEELRTFEAHARRLEAPASGG